MCGRGCCGALPATCCLPAVTRVLNHKICICLCGVSRSCCILFCILIKSFTRLHAINVQIYVALSSQCSSFGGIVQLAAGHECLYVSCSLKTRLQTEYICRICCMSASVWLITCCMVLPKGGSHTLGAHSDAFGMNCAWVEFVQSLRRHPHTWLEHPATPHPGICWNFVFLGPPAICKIARVICRSGRGSPILLVPMIVHKFMFVCVFSCATLRVLCQLLSDWRNSAFL